MPLSERLLKPFSTVSGGCIHSYYSCTRTINMPRTSEKSVEGVAIGAIGGTIVQRLWNQSLLFYLFILNLVMITLRVHCEPLNSG